MNNIFTKLKQSQRKYMKSFGKTERKKAEALPPLLFSFSAPLLGYNDTVIQDISKSRTHFEIKT